MLSDAFLSPFLFSHWLIRHNVIDVGIFLLGTLHPPTGELRFSYQSRDCGRVLPCLGGALLDIGSFLDQALKRYLYFRCRGILQFSDTSPNVAICGQP